jgi:hypothetical protein
VLTVRLAGSQSVAVGMPAFCVLLAAPTGHRLNFLPHFGSFLNEPQGMGPLDEPSQVLQPIAHLQETDALITSITQAAGLSGGGGESSASARAGRWLRVWGVGGGGTAYPFENQKHDWPFCPEIFPSVSGTGHHPVSVSTLGHLPAEVHGTGPFHCSVRGKRALATSQRQVA